MPASSNTMQVNIVATDRPVWSGQARSVSIPAQQGAMGILPNHEPILSLIKKGTVTVIEADGTSTSFDVDEGFISFDSNKLTVAVEHSTKSQYPSGQ
ncbi:F0F1 ATP synthase subunit epsilon [Bombiscardovia coagulans]|uniref:ATP synthase F0F1 subunit epsilon n=1 Tax=Bombiscardovia coagulans TaxID=686666 RepID=A0A261EQ25_9BIFI|nr:F0F1 ATP synthase subunit epsilon [Bombiscardovia coagulans]OZG48955.1 ATP synthase F0F1 subunit epsilon [Bombiscardovia coagulans]